MFLIKRCKLALLLISVLFILPVLSCAQDSIFFDISNEPEPKDPLIPGTVTNMAVVRDRLYVAARMGNRIYCYSRGTWSMISQPGGAIGDLVSDGRELYALVFPSGDPLRTSVIRRYNSGSNSWDIGVSAYNYNIQSIFNAGGDIFAGGQHLQDYQYFSILHLQGSQTLVPIAFNTSILTGAARSGGDVYFATAGNGILISRGGDVSSVPAAGTAGASINGIIETGGVIVAVGSNGGIYTLASPGSFNSFTVGVHFTGAMSVWREFTGGSWRPSLLLLGTRGQGSSLTHGYRELLLDPNSGRPTHILRGPGEASPSSVQNRPRYTASIGVHPVEAIIQLPEEVMGAYFPSPEWEPVIFASTSRSGLWSYRDGQWNAEE
ncbi:MAG: hypothetical protein FWH19_06285 [Treponema sp.]|nr:hypothetical protein [Treponema sp.]